MYVFIGLGTRCAVLFGRGLPGTNFECRSVLDNLAPVFGFLDQGPLHILAVIANDWPRRGRLQTGQWHSNFNTLKGDRPQFSVSQFRMQPSRIKIGAIGPSQRAKFDTNLGEEIGVA